LSLSHVTAEVVQPARVDENDDEVFSSNVRAAESRVRRHLRTTVPRSRVVETPDRFRFPALGNTARVLSPDPHEVAAPSDLAAFLRRLSRHFEEEPDDWQNWNVGDYLESIAAWLDATPTLPEARAERERELGEERPTWGGVAILFEIGRIYE
jgi:hypothetical protein